MPTTCRMTSVSTGMFDVGGIAAFSEARGPTAAGRRSTVSVASQPQRPCVAGQSPTVERGP